MAKREIKTKSIVPGPSLDNLPETDFKKSHLTTPPRELETIIMFPNQLDSIIPKQTRSIYDIDQIKSRPYTKSLIQTQDRPSELELIFQVNDFSIIFIEELSAYCFFFVYQETNPERREKFFVTYFLYT